LTLLAGVFIFRTAFLLFFSAHADLLGDEAYYWDWGRRPDWGYFSKPPMIGWLMGLVGWLSGDAEWGIRLTALLMGTATLAAVFLLARRLFSAHTGFLAATLILLTPGNAGLNLFFTIDALLLLAWSLALLMFWFILEKPTCLWRWGALVLLLGLGVLSKQMMLVFPLLIVVFAALSQQDRVLLRNPRLWIAILLGAAFLTPVLLWNQQHQWIMLEHTKHHFDTKELGLGKWLARTLEFPVAQALIYSPITFAAVVAVMGLSIWQWPRMDRRARFLLVFSVPPLVVFLLLSLRQAINPNWPAVYYLPAFILAAAWMQGALAFTAPAFWRRWSLRVGGAFVLVLHLALPMVFLTQLKTHKKLADLRGWEEAGQQAGACLDKVPRPNVTFVLVIGYRYDAAQMAFHMPQHPRTYRWEASGKVMSQYEVWPGPEERLGDDAMILQVGNDEPKPLANVIAQHFEKWEPLGRVEVPLGKNRKRVFDVFLGHRLKSWKTIGQSKQP